jgi:DNA-binding IclR family transcriptional regulator
MPRTATPASGPDNVSALVRGFEVLDCYAQARRPLGNGDIALATGIPKPTVSRLIATLVALGHLRPAQERDKYELAAGVVRLAQAFLGAIDVRSFARPHVVALAEATGASSFLGVRDGDEMLVIEAGRSRSAVAFLGSDVGTRMALATSALGRAWLAGVDVPTRDAVLERLRKGPVQTRVAAGAPLAAALSQAKFDGYAISLGEWHPNINAVAAPIRTPGGEVVTINCGSPAFVMPAERLREKVVPLLLKAAEALARDIGGTAGPALTRADLAPAVAPPKTPTRGKREAPAG